MSDELEADARWEAGVLAFLRRQLFTRPERVPSPGSLRGRTAVVTGANVGLGLETVRQLLGLGLTHAVLAVRSHAKGEAAASQLRQTFPRAHVDVWIVDMASYDSIRAFARQCETLDRLDIAILNAGIQTNRLQRSPETGHELLLQINYLSTLLLSILLLPTLKAKRQPDQPGRLTIVASDLWRSDGSTHEPVWPSLTGRRGSA